METMKRHSRFPEDLPRSTRISMRGALLFFSFFSGGIFLDIHSFHTGFLFNVQSNPIMVRDWVLFLFYKGYPHARGQFVFK